MRSRLLGLLAASLVGFAATACGNGSLAPTGSTNAASGAPASGSGAPAGFEVFTSTSPAFTIAHPSGWNTKTDVSGAIVAFVTPRSGSSDQFSENVNVLTETVPQGTTLEQYTAASLANADSVIQNFQKLSSSTTTLSGLPAQRMEYSGSVSGKSLQFLAEWAVSGTTAWVLTYSAEPPSYQQYLSDATATIQSFKLG